jgi:GntR family transcriptional regulator
MHELKTDRRPLHTQARQHLLNLIEEGIYQPGQQLPSESDLAAQLGISRPTLREALFNLEQEGVIVRKHGVGTFVAPAYSRRVQSGLERLESILALAERQHMSTQMLSLSVNRVPADDQVAEKLALEPEAPLTCVRRTIAVDGRPAVYLVDFASTAVLPPESLDESFTGSVLDLLVRRNNVRVREAVAEITAINADASLADHLMVDPGQALLLLCETLFTEELTPIEFSRNCFLPGLFDFHVLRR